jgi:acetyl-CoA C-acetyltransferase
MKPGASDSGLQVVVIGLGMTPVGEHWELSLRQLGVDAMRRALAEAGGLLPQAIYVGNMLAPALSGQTHLGALLADSAALRGAEAATFEAAGASGGAAFRQACLAIWSGVVESVLVVGVEKMTDRVGSSVDAALAMATDADFEAVHGMTPVAQAALRMRRYLHGRTAPDDALAGFPVTAHANALTNPLAMFHRSIELEDYRQAPMVSAPVNLYDCAPWADGAAAVVLTRGDRVPSGLAARGVLVIGSAVATAPLALHDQPDLLDLAASRLSAGKAFAQAGLSPADVDVLELHDAFSIDAALALEAAGFAEPGEGWRLAAEGEIGRTGRVPLSTFGGSKARGEVGGATGIYQIAETALQLQGRAGANQVSNARIGMVQCLGGAGATAVTHLLQAF